MCSMRPVLNEEGSVLGKAGRDRNLDLPLRRTTFGIRTQQPVQRQPEPAERDIGRELRGQHEPLRIDPGPGLMPAIREQAKELDALD